MQQSIANTPSQTFPGTPSLGSTALWFYSPCSAELAEPLSPHLCSHLQPHLLQARPGPSSESTMTVPVSILVCEAGLLPLRLGSLLDPLHSPLIHFSNQLHPIGVSPRLLSISGFSSKNTMALMTGHFLVSVSTGLLRLPTRQQCS